MPTNWLDDYIGPPAIQEESTLLPKRATLAFLGTAVTAADDPVNNRTTVSVVSGTLLADAFGNANIAGELNNTSNPLVLGHEYNVNATNATTAATVIKTIYTTVGKTYSVRGIVSVSDGIGTAYGEWEINCFAVNNAGTLTLVGTPVTQKANVGGFTVTFTVLGPNLILTATDPGPNRRWTGALDVYERSFGTALPVTPAPTVSSLNKNALTRTQGGILLTITGTTFTGATGVTFGGTAATSVTVVNATTITCVTPAMAAGTYAVVVTTPAGVSNNSVTCKFVNPSSTFGANLKRWYSATYASGVWTDASGTFNTTQSVAGARPTASTLAATTDRPATQFALAFDGVSNGLNFGGAADIFTTNVTMACLVQPAVTQSNVDSVVLAKFYNNVTYSFGIRSVAPGKASFAVNVNMQSGFQGSGTWVASAAAINTNTVHRLIATYASTAATLTRNGVLEGSGPTGTYTTGTADFNSIGCEMYATDSSTSNYYTGLIAEVVVANVTANATQQSELDAYLRDCAGQAS